MAEEHLGEEAGVHVDVRIEASVWRAEPDLIRTIRRAVGKTLLYFRNARFESCWHASVLCSDDRGMRALSRQFLESPCDTLDALAFPSGEGETETHGNHGNHGHREIYYLGDIALGYQGAMRTVSRFALDAHAHIAHLSVHSSAHLLGMRDDSLEQRSAMEHIEGRVLALLDFPDSAPMTSVLPHEPATRRIR